MKRVPAMIMILFPPFHARRKLQLRLKRDKNHSALLTRVPISANHVIAAALLLLLPSMVLFTRERERELVRNRVEIVSRKAAVREYVRQSETNDDGGVKR